MVTEKVELVPPAESNVANWSRMLDVASPENSNTHAIVCDPPDWVITTDVCEPVQFGNAHTDRAAALVDRSPAVFSATQPVEDPPSVIPVTCPPDPPVPALVQAIRQFPAVVLDRVTVTDEAEAVLLAAWTNAIATAYLRAGGGVTG